MSSRPDANWQTLHAVAITAGEDPRRRPCPETDMLDPVLRRLIEPPLDWIGRGLARRGVSANAVTAAGLALGLAAAGLIALEAFGWALALLLASRLADGLDGAVARAGRPTDFGGYVDITADFLFYGAIPLGFVLADPTANAVAGAVLLLAFYVNGASFLGFAVLAGRRGLKTAARGYKSLYYSAGLLEGTETIAFFVALCVLPGLFAPLAFAFAALTALTTILRVVLAWRVFGGPNEH